MMAPHPQMAPGPRPMMAPHPQMAPGPRPMMAPHPQMAPQPRSVAPARNFSGQPRAARPIYVNPGNRNVHVDNRRTGNSYVRVDRSRDVYVHRNTVVRPAPRPYVRAPYAYGGRRYYAYHPYAYHTYAPYYWGPTFYPFGAFVGTLAATAIIVSVADTAYRYDQGVWYAPTSEGYAVVTAPVGAIVTGLPPGAVAVGPSEYYYGGAYYERAGAGYMVVAPQAGTIVDQLPPGGEEVTIGDQRYVKFGETYYLPFVDSNGQPRYEVVEVR
jgi:hypothetical protein